MPEGPEVKIASTYYNEFFKGSENIQFEILTEYYETKYFDVFETIQKHLEKTFQPIFTIGKNLFIPLKNKQTFNFHLGMTGGWSEHLVKHCHFRVYTNDKELFFRDVRKFGKMRIVNNEDIDKKHNIEFDLLNDYYNFERHFTFLKSKINAGKSVCSALMNQSFFPGVGNYIKSEALYATKLHPEKKWGELSAKKIKELILNTQDIMQRSYSTGGAELKDFKNPFHESTFSLKVYGKETDPKGNKIESLVTSDQRKSWFCPRIQK
ncbi:hypothetical protein N9Y90_03320 [Flavobacteriales bacterium]|jgi:DNA-formamidopyrimidine glycosylase|nr:hypothetical protein [Flavobacteriales bacterium]MDB2675542.1 hypothetical protein [Flavobacteriales bacterium]